MSETTNKVLKGLAFGGACAFAAKYASENLTWPADAKYRPYVGAAVAGVALAFIWPGSKPPVG